MAKTWMLWEIRYEDGCRVWCERKPKDRQASEGFACTTQAAAEMAARLLNERECEIEMLRGLIGWETRYERTDDIGDV